MDQLEVKGLRIAYERAGAGPPLVLLHAGCGSNSRMWRRQLAELADAFTVVAWDAPGCGCSSDPPEGFGASGSADCLAAFIDELGLGRPHVLGLSLGSMHALELYRWHPTVPRTLVLAWAYAGWVGSLPAEVLERALREADLPPEQWVRGYLPGFFTQRAPAELIEEVVALLCQFPHPAGNRAMLHAFGRADLRYVLARIRVPTLLYGDQDVRSPLPVAEDLRAQIPTSRLVVMAGVGHVSNMEVPERFNAEVRRFLREVES
jgi:pimeloyl-ACP methyl ester carboxylesterase